MKYQGELTKLLRGMENKEVIEVTIGKVLTPPPNLTISIWDGNVILENNDLYMNNRLFDDYTRDYSLEGDITEQSMLVDSSDMTLKGQGPHAHSLLEWGGVGSYKAEGTIVNTDTLKKGDLVKLTPAQQGQIWFVDYKIRKLGG